MPFEVETPAVGSGEPPRRGRVGAAFGMDVGRRTNVGRVGNDVGASKADSEEALSSAWYSPPPIPLPSGVEGSMTR